jgi:hypothetical protein
MCPYQFVAFLPHLDIMVIFIRCFGEVIFKFSIERNWFCNPYPRNRLDHRNLIIIFIHFLKLIRDTNNLN